MVASAATEPTAGNDGAATEHTEGPQLQELVNPEAGLSSEIELKVIRSKLMDYRYTCKGIEVATQKLQVLLLSKIPEQYCLGGARMQKKDKSELKKLAQRWQVGTTWRFKAIALFNDKPNYINTSCRISIDLRKSQAQALLQSTSFPQVPVPIVTIREVLQLKEMQRFDLMAIVTEIIEVRSSGTGMRIVDVRLVDGSKQINSTTTEYASCPLTLFLNNEKELAFIKNCISKTPLVFMCLEGKSTDGQIQIKTVKDHSWWEEALLRKNSVIFLE